MPEEKFLISTVAFVREVFTFYRCFIESRLCGRLCPASDLDGVHFVSGHALSLPLQVLLSF